MSAAPIDPTDILALVLMAIFTMRRMEVKGTDPRAFPNVRRAAFEAWRDEALRARSISIHACFLKFATNSVWFFGFRNRVIPPVLQTGGWIIFMAWLLALTYAWWRSSGAKGRAERLGIVVGRRLVPASEPERSAPAERGP